MTTIPGIQTKGLAKGKTGQDDEIYYPEADGMPLPDAHEQEEHYIDAVSVLRLQFDGPTTAVHGDTFVYYEEGDPKKVVAPDCYVAFDINKESLKARDTYLAWEAGKMPDFVLEIGSSSSGTYDRGGKRDLYASLGVREYWRFDPTGGEHYGEPLVGEYLAEGTYHRFELTTEPEGEVRGHSPILGLDLHWQEGRLRFYDPVAGHWLETFTETKATAERERARAEQATVRAEQAEEQVRILQQRLRELGHTDQ